MLTLRIRVACVMGMLITGAMAAGACRKQPPPAKPKVTRSERVVRQVMLNTVWPPGSPEECIATQLRQGLSVQQAIDACKIDLTGATVGADKPGGLGSFPVIVSSGSKTPTTAACVSAPTRGGFGAPGGGSGATGS